MSSIDQNASLYGLINQGGYAIVKRSLSREDILKKLLLLQALSLLGLLTGVFLAPENPIYPFAPDKTNMVFIHLTEAIITCMLSASTAIFAIYGKFWLRLSYTHVTICSLMSGVLAVSLPDFRLGSFSLPPLYLVSLYTGVLLLLIMVGVSVEKIRLKRTLKD
ncbi:MULTISPECIES: hypothetical protein [unclassified Pseudoalteromonas]|uniref:hypothetical protein n=1 Tax=unclassified Pseudoalteromonas TaxID=194690 RepID=UPI002098109F|nr:hypothetical protein [Pseudoalteromonas sp. XMcav2-N]MCO7187859.1 hypothetical protein [Pseudoalteromonas sp. XMcav2-N]